MSERADRRAPFGGRRPPGPEREVGLDDGVRGPGERAPLAAGRPPRLRHDQLVRAQQETLAAPRRRYGLLARAMFTGLDLLYGKRRTLSKFKVLELVARVPYQAWEQVAYIAITHTHSRTGLARRIYDRVQESREQQDNEQWHLLVLEDLISRSGRRESTFWYFWVPQAIALFYYHVSWLLFVLSPRWSYRLNADFEDHAEHEYMQLVADHPEWEELAYDSAFASDYGSFDSLADLFRQIGHDERFHKEASIRSMGAARFG
jgi:ubiquinol oxidase